MAKKHKKKVYNTPKKLKHVHRKISVDKFIESFNNPKYNSCENSILSIHFDRKYCGKCNISEKLKIED